jgi:hypothetical protein
LLLEYSKYTKLPKVSNFIVSVKSGFVVFRNSE